MRASAASGAGSTGRPGHRGDARPPRADALLTAVLVSSSLLALATGARAGILAPPPDREPDAGTVLLVLGQTLPLLQAHRHPVPAVAAAATTSVLGDLCRLPSLPTDAGVLLVVYSGVAQSRDRGRLGTGVRTFVSASAPYVLAVALLLVGQRLTVAVLAGLGFGAGRAATPVLRRLSGAAEVWDGDLRARLPVLKAMAAAALLAALVLVLPGPVR